MSPKISNVDVFSIVSDESYAYVNFLQLSLGSIVRSHTMEVKKKMDEKDEDILPLIITEIRQIKTIYREGKKGKSNYVFVCLTVCV